MCEAVLDISAMSDTSKAALDRAIKGAGGLTRLAEALSISKQAVAQWDEVPPLRVLDVERASGVSRSELRPDLYPLDEPEAARA